MGFAAKTLFCVASICAAQSIGSAQGSGIVCTHGEGRFSQASLNHLTVVVDAQKSNGFAARACQANILSSKNATPVAHSAWQVDVDLMDVNLGLGAPVVAFQVKQTEAASGVTYLVYLMRGAPQLIRTITGGSYFRAADIDLDGRIEIWAGDIGASGSFDGIPLANFDSMPAIAMRFQKDRLIDVSAEFLPEYDRQIAQIKTSLDARQLSDFKNSDGSFASIPPWEIERIRALRSTKIKVLEIVWDYLYSGREQQASAALAEMWPAADLERIRALIEKTRATGIASQVDGTSSPGPSLRKLRHARVLDLTMVERTINMRMISSLSEVNTSASPSSARPPLPEHTQLPVAISLFSTPPSDADYVLSRNGLLVDLLIDSAGKVSSAKMLRKEEAGPASDSLLAASAHWKFIPAMEYGQPVASHIRLIVSPYR